MTPRRAGPRRVALVGKPNVGKSSLMNKLAGDERSVVHDVAGTTVDPVDSLVELGGKVWRFVDTAGLRKRVSHATGTEFYASLRTKAAIETSEVAILLIDASVPITEQDLRVLSMVADAGRALVIAFNKWDLVDEDRRYKLDREIDRELVRVPWAQRVNISAQTGRAVQKLVPAMETALESWDKRIPTGRLNTWLKEIVAATPPPMRGGGCRASCSPRRQRPVRRRSCCSRPGSSRPATAASSSAGCVRRSDSTAARSASRSGCARSGLANSGRGVEQPSSELDGCRPRCDHRRDMVGRVGDFGDVRTAGTQVDDELVRSGRRDELIPESVRKHDRPVVSGRRDLHRFRQGSGKRGSDERFRDQVVDAKADEPSPGRDRCTQLRTR